MHSFAQDSYRMSGLRGFPPLSVVWHHFGPFVIWSRQLMKKNENLKNCLKADLHDTTVLYDCSFWCIRFSLKSLRDQLQHSQANSKQELCFYDIIAYAKVKIIYHNRTVWIGLKKTKRASEFLLRLSSHIWSPHGVTCVNYRRFFWRFRCAILWACSNLFSIFVRNVNWTIFSATPN